LVEVIWPRNHRDCDRAIENSLAYGERTTTTAIASWLDLASNVPCILSVWLLFGFVFSGIAPAGKLRLVIGLKLSVANFNDEIEVFALSTSPHDLGESFRMRYEIHTRYFSRLRTSRWLRLKPVGWLAMGGTATLYLDIDKYRFEAWDG
jgi:hypothetical protein